MYPWVLQPDKTFCTWIMKCTISHAKQIFHRQLPDPLALLQSSAKPLFTVVFLQFFLYLLSYITM